VIVVSPLIDPGYFIMELVIFIGLQGSGKSTFYQLHFASTHAYVSKDLLRNNSRPARRQLQLVEEALQSGCSVVIDNTNPTVEDRAGLISLGHHYSAEAIGYYFEVQVKKSLERNRQRTGKARVPNIAIFATVKKLVRPTYVEGFDKLFYVRSDDNFAFDISDWQEEGEE
jgi:predicted kinase